LAAIALAASACGGPRVENADVTAEQIERVSTPRVEKEDPAASVRLQPLSALDIARQGEAAGHVRFCRFQRNGVTLLAAWNTNAIARIGGQLRHLVQSAPVGETGGFFGDRQISVSIGLVTPGGAGARIAVTNRGNQAQQEWIGEWLCGR